MRRHRWWWAVVAVPVLLVAGCGGDDDDDDQATAKTEPASEASSAAVLEDVRAAAEAVRAAGTGRFELILDLRGVPDVPDGPLGTKYGAYDIPNRRLELRWVLPADRLRDLAEEEGLETEVAAGTRENPHVVSLWSEAGGLLFRVPARNVSQWVKFPDEVLDQGAQQLGVDLAEAMGGDGPPLIAALIDAAGPAQPAPARADDPAGGSRYTVQLDGQNGMDLMSSGSFQTIFESLDEKDQQKLLGMQVPADVLVADGRVTAVDVDLKEIFLELLRLAVPGAKEEKDQIEAMSFEALARYSDAGTPVDLPTPAPDEIVTPEAAGFTVEE